MEAWMLYSDSVRVSGSSLGRAETSPLFGIPSIRPSGKLYRRDRYPGVRESGGMGGGLDSSRSWFWILEVEASAAHSMALDCVPEVWWHCLWGLTEQCTTD